MIHNITIMGCGWLGLPLGARLAKAGYAVKGSTTRAEKLPRLREAGIAPFLLEAGESVQGPQQEDFFAADLLIVNIPPGGRRNPAVEEAHPRQIRAILEKAQAAGIPYLLFASSTSVYGEEGRVVSEADALKPETPSGRALAEVEGFLRQAQRPQATLLRLAGLVGGTRLPGRFFAGKTGIPGGDAPVNLVHLEDCIGFILAVIQQEKWGETYNLCADEHPSRAQLYTHQARKLGLPPPEFITGDDYPFKIVSNEKGKRELGYVYRFGDPMGF
jgi:nucleoside-diphosphate-sugar epimerase